MHKVLDFYRYNPNATPFDVLAHFEEEFEVSKNVARIKAEVEESAKVRATLRPLYGERLEIDERMKYALSDMEMEVYMEYPPRQGSDAQREALRNKLKKENQEYEELRKQYRKLSASINEYEDQLKDLELGAKNARRLMETFTMYVEFINEFAKGREQYGK